MTQCTRSGTGGPQSFRKRLALSTALASLALAGYGRAASAGSCILNVGTYECSGGANDGVDITQTLSGAPLDVTTLAGFGIDTTTTSGNAFNLTGTGGLTFTDLNNSAITGAADGIEANNTGGGALSITTTGAVTGNSFEGIATYHGVYGVAGNGTDLTIDSVDVVGGSTGIRAYNFGTGLLRVTTTGTVTGNNREGIDTYNSFLGTNLTIEASDVTGGERGINADNFGSGALSVTTTGNVTGGTNDGINAFNSGNGTSLTVEAADVTGGDDGIVAENLGSGSLRISATGLVEGTNGQGVNAQNGDFFGGVNNGPDLTIEVADVTGRFEGIRANNFGGGVLSITATGQVTSAAGSSSTRAVDAYSGYDGTGQTIDVVGVSGRVGIEALNRGGGALSITATGFVEGTGRNGIDAQNGNGGGYYPYATRTATDLTIVAAAVSGGEYGINARNYGSGALNITATGPVSGGAAYDGINAENSYNGTDLTVSVTSVSGGDDAIFAFNDGSGATSVIARGTLTATAQDGIDVFSQGTSLTVAAVDITAGDDGIDADSQGTGALSVTVTGQITAGDDGIDARNQNSGTDLTVSAAGVDAQEDGIDVRNYGSGTTSVTATGTVSGATDDGIFAVASGTSLTISAAAVSGYEAGIIARHYGSDALSITASGPVAATGALSGNLDPYDPDHSYGIFAFNRNGVNGYGVGLSVSAVDVSGEEGIYAENSPYTVGALSITTTGHVQGSAYDGIDARQSAAAAVTVSAHDVTGAEEGIDVRSFNGGAISVTVDGAVVGGTGEGIRTRTDELDIGGVGNSTIVLNAGAAVSSANGVAITNDGGDSDTTVNAGAGVTGAIQLGNGSDVLTFDGGDFSNVTSFDGGDDAGSGDGFVDRLEFRNVTGNLDGGTAVNWELVTVGANGVITLSNTLTAENVVVGDGGTLGGTGTVAGALTVESGGTLGPGASAGDFTVAGDLTLLGGGGLEFEFFTPLNFDTLDVAGAVAFDFGGEIDLLFDVGFNPFDGLELTFLTSAGIAGFDNLLFSFIGLDPLFSAFVELGPQEDSLFVTFNSVGDPGGDGNAVPEPGTLALFGAGLLGLFGLGRWRRRNIAA